MIFIRMRFKKHRLKCSDNVQFHNLEELARLGARDSPVPVNKILIA